MYSFPSSSLCHHVDDDVVVDVVVDDDVHSLAFEVFITNLAYMHVVMICQYFRSLLICICLSVCL